MTTPCCPACGQKIRKLNPHYMDRTKANLLMQVARLNLEHEWVKVQRDGRLIPFEERSWSIQCDDVHALRLTWFGLLERKEFRSGLYKVTSAGIAFLRGWISIPAHIYCKDGIVIERSKDLMSVDQVRGIILDKPYWDNYAMEQKPMEQERMLF